MSGRIEKRETKPELCLRIDHWGYMNCPCSASTLQCEIPTRISDIVELKKESPYPHSLASLELLNKYGSRLTRFNKNKLDKPSHETLCSTTGGPELSTSEIVKVAREGIIHYFSQKSDDLSMLSCPFSYGHPGLSYKDAEYVELVQFLLASAEMVSNQQFDHANKLLSICDQLSNNTGNPIQRVVYYFVEAIREKIDQETGRNVSKGLQVDESQPWVMEEAIRSLTPPIIACYQELPFNQVTKFTGMQAILEYVASAKKIHFVDLAIDSGVQWTILMQGLVDRYEHPLVLLKITVVETSSKEWIYETGKRLACFAEALNLPFSFKIVIVSDMKDLREDLFDLETGEVLGSKAQQITTKTTNS